MTKALLFRSLSSLTACLVFAGCASMGKPVVWTARDVSFANFEVLEIQPVVNATETELDQEILIRLTDQLTERLVAKGLTIQGISKMTNGVLLVKTDLVVFKVDKYEYAYGIYGSSRWVYAKCSLRTRLVDKTNNHIVAEISTVKVASDEGLGSIQVPFGQPINETDMHEEVLTGTVSAIVEEVAKLMAPQEPG